MAQCKIQSRFPISWCVLHVTVEFAIILWLLKDGPEMIQQDLEKHRHDHDYNYYL